YGLRPRSEGIWAGAHPPRGAGLRFPVSLEPIFPDYAGANVRSIMPTLLAPQRGAGRAWMPAPVRDADQVVLLVLDGLGWDQFVEFRQHMPTLATFDGGPITTVVPSTT